MEKQHMATKSSNQFPTKFRTDRGNKSYDAHTHVVYTAHLYSIKYVFQQVAFKIGSKILSMFFLLRYNTYLRDEP